MALSDIVQVNISLSAAKLTRQGFGMPLVLAADAPSGFTERVRFYTDLNGLSNDFASSTATYKMAAVIFSQLVPPPQIAVGRLANKPTQHWTITPVANNSTVYNMKVNGTLVSYTSDSSATAAEICTGLKTAIDALSLGITVTAGSTLVIVANTAGAFFSVQVLDTTLLKIAQDHTDPGYAADLTAINLENTSWYAILNPFNSKACASAIAGWAESNSKLFIGQTQDSDVINLALSSDTGGSQTIAGALAGVDFRTSLWYHPRTDAFLDAGIVGVCLPLDPGSETWAYKTVAGVEAVQLTSTQRTNALAKNVNVYETIAGLNLSESAKVSGNEYIDVIRFRDWFQVNLQADILAALANTKKIPFTDDGIAVVQGVIKARLQIGVAVGGLASNPPPKVTVPLAANVSPSDKAARTLTGVKFDAVQAGAIQATVLQGNLTT